MNTRTSKTILNCLFFLFLTPLFVHAQSNEPRWDDTFWAYGVDGEIHDVLQTPDGSMYVAGEFRRIGGLQANGIAMWNGTRWSALGRGLGEGAGNIIYSLEMDANGDLFIAGDFFEVVQENGGVVEVSNLAVWNGTQWEGVASGVNDVVYDLHADDDGIYIAGAFSADGANEFELNRITYWDGSSFSTVGDGLGNFAGVVAYALEIDENGILYAGGAELSGGLFRWDGQEWSAFEARHDGTVFDILAAGNGQLYVAGDFPTVTQPDNSTLAAPRVALWNGTQWEALGNGFDDEVRTLALDMSGNLYAGGVFTSSNDGATGFHYVARWDGSWQPVGSVNEPDAFEGVNVVVPIAGDVMAGGSMQLLGTTLVNGLGRWNGSAWSGIGGQGMDAGVEALLVTPGGDLYAGGSFGYAGNVLVNFVAVRSNGQWLPLGQGTNGTVSAIAAGADGSIYVGGDFSNVFQSDGTELLVYNIARWDGTTWSALGTGFNNPVKSIYVDAANTVYAGGEFTQDGSEQMAMNYIAAWNGTAWTSPGGGTDGTVWVLEEDADGAVMAGGSFTSAGGQANTGFLAAWDGAAWTPVSPSTVLDADVYAMALDAEGVLTVGGAFTEVEAGFSANYVAQWDGTAWSPLGTALGNGTSNCCVRALGYDETGALIVGGDFSGLRRPAGPEIQANNIGSWSPETSWQLMASGVDGAVLALEGNATDLFLGGDFFNAGAFPSSHIGRWSSAVTYVSVEDAIELPEAMDVFSIYPNPARSNATLALEVGRTQHIQVELYDMLGRKVSTLFDEYVASPGALDIQVEAAGLPAGSYLVRVKGDAFATTRTFVRVK